MSRSLTKTDLERAKENARLVNAYHRVFESRDGKLVLEDIKRAFGTKAAAFLPLKTGGYDVTHAAIRDGQRQVVTHIETILETTKPDGDGNVEKPAVEVITENQPT